MTLSKLREMTHIYARDTNGYVFPEDYIDMFINQAIDVIREYPIFRSMKYLKDSTDEPELLPLHYHYILALFAASRCFDIDERFYEGTEKRNEFESKLEDLIAEIQTGNQPIYDKDGNELEDPAVYIDAVTDVYFTRHTEDKIKDTDEIVKLIGG